MPEATASTPATPPEGRQQQPRAALDSWRGWQHLAIVLWVAFAIPVTSSVFRLALGTIPQPPASQALRLWTMLILEVTGLVVLRYVMARQERSWRDLGWDPGPLDLPRAAGLTLAVLGATWVFWIVLSYACWFISASPPAAGSMNVALGFGVSPLSIAFIILNPFFEELIVRAYTISEVMALRRSSGEAVAISVAVQLSYHLYQGLVNVLILGICFTIMSIYFVRTRRIAPIVLVHLAMDVHGLLRGAF